MASTSTSTITVVKGDDGPDIVATIQQDSSGTPLVLTNRQAYVVLIDTTDPDNYVAKWQITIEDTSAGKVRISWIKDPITYESYLDDLTPGVRYELQVYLGRTDMPPSYASATGFYSYFTGQFNFTGSYQEGSPVFKHETEDLYLSRSLYDGNSQPDEYVWLVTSLQAATWQEVKDQVKANLDVSDLTVLPLWNYRQILTAAVAPTYVNYPAVGTNFTTSEDYIIEPGGKHAWLGTQNFVVDTVTNTASDIETTGTQTVLTRIPIAVKPAYRLSESS
jgi:hypothetical protein